MTAIGAGSIGAAGKYMTFRLASEEYGLEISKVQELIGSLEITPIPRSAPHVRGVINQSGKVIPVVDLRVKFGMAPTDPTSQTVIIVVQLAVESGGLALGILVDEVLEVRAISADEIELPQRLLGQAGPPLIRSVGKTDKRVIFLLDVESILAPEERSVLATLG